MSCEVRSFSSTGCQIQTALRSRSGSARCGIEQNCRWHHASRECGRQGQRGHGCRSRPRQIQHSWHRCSYGENSQSITPSLRTHSNVTDGLISVSFDFGLAKTSHQTLLVSIACDTTTTSTIMVMLCAGCPGWRHSLAARVWGQPTYTGQRGLLCVQG